MDIGITEEPKGRGLCRSDTTSRLSKTIKTSGSIPIRPTNMYRIHESTVQGDLRGVRFTYWTPAEGRMVQ